MSSMRWTDRAQQLAIFGGHHLHRKLLQGTTAQAPAPASHGGGLTTGQKWAIALGAVLFGMAVKVLLCGCWFARRHYRKKKRAALHEAATTAGPLDWELEVDEITIMKRSDGSDWELGSGNFGKVLKGMRGGVQPVAIKQLFRRDKNMEEAFIREIAMLKYVSRDRNIVQFYGACVQENNLLLVAEMMEGGDLMTALSSDTGRQMGWYNKGKSIAVDISRGLAFLHSSRVIHRDLKSKNVLLTRDGAAKIGDVGMAQIMTEGYLTKDNALGTLAWAAPELLLGEKCTEKVDIYSLGVVLWEIVTHEMPQRGAIRDVLVPSECPQEVADIISACMQRDVKARPSAREICRQLYSAEPVWEEPEDLRTMLDESTFEVTEEMDVLGNPISIDDSAETLSRVLDAKAVVIKGEKPQLQSVVSAIRAKLEATRAKSNADSTLSGPRSVPASSPPASERNGSSMYEPSHQGSGFGSS